MAAPAPAADTSCCCLARRLLLAAGCGLLGAQAAVCPGRIEVAGHGPVSLVPTGWLAPPGTVGAVEVLDGKTVVPHIRGRAYFADTCVAGVYDRHQYLALSLLGKTLRYTTDLSGAGCGCNAAFYLLPMRQNQRPSICRDYYCDANQVCGESCAEIDIQEANQYAWHSTLHSRKDPDGLAGGCGGGEGRRQGPRDWPTSKYAPGSSCIDTAKAFQVAVSFPVDSNGTLVAMEILLSQEGHSCTLKTRVHGYAGLPELSEVLSKGMTPVVSYWSSDDMRWLDGPGKDHTGPCRNDTAKECRDSVLFYGFSVEDLKKGDASVEKAGAKDARRGRPVCPGGVQVRGYGPVSLVPAGWHAGAVAAAPDALEVRGGHEVVPHVGSRAYFADTCKAGVYSHWQYVALDLLGKRLRYTTDLSAAGCGCSAALSLVPMRNNTEASACGDFFCNAGGLCGVRCAEVMVQQANRFSWRSGLGSPRHVGGSHEWMDGSYSPSGKCINTSRPFEVVVTFPLDAEGQLRPLKVELVQNSTSCLLSARLGDAGHMRDFTEALARGVTPVVSYQSSEDRHGHCASAAKKTTAQCGSSVKFYGFSMESLGSAEAAELEAEAAREAAQASARADIKLAVEALLAEERKATEEAAKRMNATCPGTIDMKGHGRVSVVPTGWGTRYGGAAVHVREGRKVVPHMGGRAYFADSCTAGVYRRESYLALRLLGRVLRYTVDVSGATCGCNAAFYLASMRQNPRPSKCHDYYCDANSVCGESCDEVDIQEANQFAWHSTLHIAKDQDGYGGGFGGGGKGWNGPRDWSASEYGPGAKCIDTKHPFTVAASFPVDKDGALEAVEVRLSQDRGGDGCSLRKRVQGYKGLPKLSAGLALGMTPVVSYWSSNDMLWLDGVGKDGKGYCTSDNATACGETVLFYDFSIEDLEVHGMPKVHDKALAGAAHQTAKEGSSACPGAVQVAGHGRVSLVPAGALNSAGLNLLNHQRAAEVHGGREVVPHIGGRAYFADTCSPDTYDRNMYLGLKLLGKTLRYTTDVSGAGMSASGCGCNVEFYLVAMRQNTRPGACHDYYCDANAACGVSCAEIDIQKASKFAWHSTLHAAKDHTGVSVQGGGFDWNGPRDWSASQYAPGAKCIDTARPFQVAASFPVDTDGSLIGVEVNLTQAPNNCTLSARLDKYAGMAELSAALAAGMTPVVSYASSSDNLLMNGEHLEPCNSDGTSKCGGTARFYDMSIESLKPEKVAPVWKKLEQDKAVKTTLTTTTLPPAAKTPREVKAARRRWEQRVAEEAQRERRQGREPAALEIGLRPNTKPEEAVKAIMASIEAMKKHEAAALKGAVALLAKDRESEAAELKAVEAAQKKREEEQKKAAALKSMDIMEAARRRQEKEQQVRALQVKAKTSTTTSTTTPQEAAHPAASPKMQPEEQQSVPPARQPEEQRSVPPKRPEEQQSVLPAKKPEEQRLGKPQEPSTATPEPEGQRCAKAFQQCGGKRWTTWTCCQTGCECHELSEYYSQCRPMVDGPGTCAAAAAAAASPALPPAAGGGVREEEVLLRKHMRGGRVDPQDTRSAWGRWLGSAVLAGALGTAAAAVALANRRRAVWRKNSGPCAAAGNSEAEEVRTVDYAKLLPLAAVAVQEAAATPAASPLMAAEQEVPDMLQGLDGVLVPLPLFMQQAA